jgi:CubicO group peptidase (beta-lactamase class C family)
VYPYICRRQKKVELKRVIVCGLLIGAFFSCTQKQTVEQQKSTRQEPSFRKLSDDERQKYRTDLQNMYDSLLNNNSFNGAILVAKNGEILLEEYKGYVNLSKKDSITPQSPFHVASVSKTFTGAAILKLWEQNKLNLDDSLQVFFPDLPYKGITVKMLLNHRSGLPNYLYFMKDDSTWGKNLATNQDVLRFMKSNQPAVYNQPGKSFHYCNTNYALLALIVEKVTNQSFPDYVRHTIFEPLGMKDSYIFSIKDSANYPPSYWGNNRVFGLEPLDCVYGDKNVFSTPRDLLQWDIALYNNTYLNQDTYNQATIGYSFEKQGTHNYGLGWRLLLRPESKVVYHNGWWHGNNATFTRLVADTATVIIVGNKYNRKIYSGMKFAQIFDASAKAEKDVE